MEKETNQRKEEIMEIDKLVGYLREELNTPYTWTVSYPPYASNMVKVENEPEEEDGNEEQENNFPDQVFFDDILDDVKHVIYNDPATIVTFKDGTKVCVKTCSSDKFDKEIGLVYALVKRLYADDVDENGYLKATGLGEKIRKIVKDGFDQKEQLAKRKAKKEAAREAKKEANKTAK